MCDAFVYAVGEKTTANQMPQTDRNMSLATLTLAGMNSLVWPFGMATHSNAAVSLQTHAASVCEAS